MNIKLFMQTAKTNGGGSYNLNTGEFNPSAGFMVSMQGHEQRHKEFDEDTLLRYIANKSELLADRDNFIGVWRTNDGEWCFDISQCVGNEVEAVELGLSRRQEAIWDCAKAEEIALGGAQG